MVEADLSTLTTTTTVNPGLLVWSNILGWSYFIAWSVSFYPQVIQNYFRKKVTGLSFDYIYYNIVGYCLYSVYNIVNYVEQHKHNLTKSVKLNDIFFSCHAVLLTAVLIFQLFYYPKAKSQKISPFAFNVIVIIFILAAYNAILAAMGDMNWVTTENTGKAQLNFIEYFGYVKALISFIKYVPQAWVNFNRKSTVGWSIHNILLDFTGGSLSLAQQFMDCYMYNNWSSITDNIPKFLLAQESVIFDLLFMFQHYCLYVDRTDYAEIEFSDQEDSSSEEYNPAEEHESNFEASQHVDSPKEPKPSPKDEETLIPPELNTYEDRDGFLS